MRSKSGLCHPTEVFFFLDCAWGLEAVKLRTFNNPFVLGTQRLELKDHEVIIQDLIWDTF